MYSKVVNVLASTGGGTQDITFTPNTGDPSWTPKVAIFQWNRALSQTSAWIEHQCFGIGYTDGTNQKCVSSVSEDNQAISDTAGITSTDSLITALTPTGTVTTVDAVAVFSAWLSNGIRINWTNTPAAQFYLTILFLGGDDITNVSIGTWTSDNTTGDHSVTGLSFRPDFGMFLYPGTSNDNTATAGMNMGVGAATASGAQWCQSFTNDSAADTMSTSQLFDHTRIVVRHSSSAIVGQASFVSFNNDGFTFNISDNFSSPIHYLLMKGGSYAVGNNTEPAGTGNQTITTNSNVKAVAIFGNDTSTGTTVQADNVWSSGFADNGINQFGHVWHDTNGGTDSVVVSALDGASHIYNNITANATVNSTVWDDSAIVSSVTDTGFVLNWDNVGNARPFRYIAFGETPPPQPSGIVSKVVTVAAPTAAGNQDITFTADPSWTPKAAIFQYSRAALAAGFNEGTAIGYGLTDGTNSRSINYVSEDAVTSSDTSTVCQNNAVVVMTNLTGTITTVDALASFVTWLSNGVRINWSNPPTFACNVTVTFLGGSALTNANVGTLSTGVTTDPISVTSLSYQPDFGLFLCTSNTAENTGSSTTPCMSIGAATSSGAQWAQSLYHADSSGASAARTNFSHSRVVVAHTTTLTGYATFTSFNANGFTLTPTDAFPSSYFIYYLVLKGGDYAVGNSTEPAGTGDQTITTDTDVKSVMVFGVDHGTADTIVASGMWSSGTGAGATNYGYSTDELPASDPMANTTYYSSSYLYNNITANATATSSAIDDQASLSSVSSTGFVINWNNIGQARPFRYITFGGAGTTPVSIEKTHLYHITGLITASRTHKYNVIGKVSNSKTHKWIISIKVTTSKTHKYNTFKIVALTKTHKWNSIAKVLPTKTHKYNIISRVSPLPSKTHKFNLLNSVPTASKTHKYNVVGKVSKSKTHKYDIEQSVSQVSTTKTHKYNIIKIVVASKTHKYSLISVISTSKTHKYNLSGRITTSKTHKYNLAGVISTTKTHLYNILHRVTCIEKIHVYNISNITITRSKTHKYNVIKRVTVTKTHKYSLPGKVTASRTHKYNIIAKITTTKTHLYNIITKTTQTKTHKYNVISVVSTSKTHKYNLAGRITVSKTHKYGIAGVVTRTHTHLYNILHRVTCIEKFHRYNISNITITKSKTHKYNVIKRVTVSKTHKYDIVSGTVSTTKTHKYHIISIVSTTKTHKYNVTAPLSEVSTTKTHKYNVIGKISASKTHLYGILGRVSTSKTHKYGILNQITPPLPAKTHKYNILVSVTKTKTHKYNLSNAVTKSKTHKYDIHIAVSKTKTHKYNLAGKITRSRTHKFNIIKRVSRTHTHKFNIRIAITGAPATKTHLYNIRSKVTKTKTHKYNTIGRIRKTTKHRWNSGGKVTTTKTHIYDIGQFFELPIGAGSSTVVHIKVPERIRIVDIIADIRNLAIANIELRPFEPKIICIGLVELNEERISPIVKIASGKARHRIASQLVIPQVIDTIDNLAVSGRIGIEELPLLPNKQFQTRSYISLYQTSPRIHISSYIQITYPEIIRLSSSTELIQQHQTRIASLANLELGFINNIQLKTIEIMTRERKQVLEALIDVLKSDAFS